VGLSVGGWIVGKVWTGAEDGYMGKAMLGLHRSERGECGLLAGRECFCTLSVESCFVGCGE